MRRESAREKDWVPNVKWFFFISGVYLFIDKDNDDNDHSEHDDDNMKTELKMKSPSVCVYQTESVYK